MTKKRNNPESVKKPEPFHWELRPEPAPTPRDRRWLTLSVTTLVVWLAALVWLAHR